MLPNSKVHNLNYRKMWQKPFEIPKITPKITVLKGQQRDCISSYPEKTLNPSQSDLLTSSYPPPVLAIQRDHQLAG